MAFVSSRGAAQYTIPLQIPAGVNGLAPRLSLNYSHELDNGIVGIGWSIGGLSQISRCSKSIALDGGGGPATLSINDAYCLDGNRLRLTLGSYGQTSSTYQTAIETYARATVTGANANGPTSWEIRKADGLIYEYGNSEDSRIETVGTPAVRAWALNSIRDRSGNAIQFVYEEDPITGGFRPIEVRYGANLDAQTAHTTKVMFVYEQGTRPDPIYGLRFGARVEEYKRLDRIEVVDIASAAEVRTYDLTYGAVGGAGGRSRLSSIQESRDGDTLPATNLLWTSGTAGWNAAEVVTGVTLPTGTFMREDINGDNRSDVLFSSSVTSGAGVWQYMLGIEAGFGPVTSTTNSNANFASAQFMEWNGDGMMDVLVPCASGTTWCVMVANGSGFGSLTNTGVPVQGQTLATDVNCDGLDDIARLDTSGLPNRLYTRVRSGTGFAAETLAFTAAPSIQTYPDFGPTFQMRARSVKRKLDFNGDGCGDFVTNTQDNDPEPGTPTLYSLAVFLGSSTGLQHVGWIGEQTQQIAIISAGDFNGDGQTDILRSHGTTSLVAYLGTGGLFNFALQGPSTTGYADLSLYVADYDGDGLDDIVMPEVSTKTWHVARSTGNGFATLASLGYSDGAARYPMDLNGDGGADVVGASPAFGNVLRYRLRNAPLPDFVDRITDGFDEFVDFDYVRLTNAGAVYTPGTGATYPTLEYQGPMFVVSRMRTSTGTGATYDITYRYEAGRLHLQGLGFLGFGKRSQTDSRSGIVTEESYLQDPLRWETVGSRQRVLVKQSAGTPILDRTFTWNALTAGSGATERRFPHITSSVTQRYEVGGAIDGELISTTTTNAEAIDAQSGFIYDSTTTVQEAGTGNGLQPGAAYVQRTHHPFARILNDTVSWCLGRPERSQSIRSHNQFGGTEVTRTTERTWDTAKCRVTQEVLEPGHSTRQVTTGIGYDAFGNVNSTTVTGKNPDGSSMAARTTTADWGSNGRLLRSTTNALSQQTSFGWDEALGLRTSLTDPNQLQTSWAHDGFGRLTRENRPDGTATAVRYEDCASHGCLANNKLVVVRSELDTGGATITDTLTFFDRRDRPLATKTMQLSGASTRVERRYDAFGRVERESAPCDWIACTYFWTVYTYDLLGRPTQVDRPTSEVNTATVSALTFYEGLRTRNADLLGKQSITFANVVGQALRNVDQDNFHVEVDYDPFGNPVRVTDSTPLTLQTAAFDVRGFRTDLAVLGAGARSFTYNSLGEMLTELDAKPQTTAYAYDALGRLTSLQDLQGTNSWDWGDSALAKNIGRLEAKTAATGVQESYQYDAFGRPMQTTVDLGSDGTHLVNYAYNALGALDSLTYPTSTSSYRLKLKYDYANGQLLRIKDFAAPTNVFWEAGTTNARGQITRETLGNGLVTNRHFDAVTAVPRTIQTGVGSGQGIQNLAYFWDPMGNLTQRQDANVGLTEDIYYDNLYRIDYTRLDSTTNLDVAYDARGNITSKQDASDVTPEAGSATWLANDLPATLGGSSPQGSGSSEFFYDADGNRYKQLATRGSTTETTVYVAGLLERVTTGTTTDFRHYVQTPAGLAAIHIRSSTGTNATYYTLRDHLGSVDKITDGSGAVTIALSYSAYGQRRGSNWTGVPSATDWTTINAITHRGFTGHEHLDNVGLIHMNGRVYQPTVGRFLSSDPMIDWAQRTQAFNRYAYLGNGPLSGIDPLGFTEEVLEEVVVTAPRWPGAWIRNLPIGINSPAGPRPRVVRPRAARAPPPPPPEIDTCTQQESMGMIETAIADFQFWLIDNVTGSVPSLNQSVVNFSGGLGDVALLGFGNELRSGLGVGSVDTSSRAYSAGEWTGTAALTATGVVGGIRAAGARGAGMEFSHAIPARAGGPRSIWNGNYVPTRAHALSDPFRYRFMPRSWKELNPMPNRAWQLWTRTPNTIKGTAAGIAAGSVGQLGAGSDSGADPGC